MPTNANLAPRRPAPRHDGFYANYSINFSQATNSNQLQPTLSGVLRPAMMAFYANASDFTRRLTSVKANGKFSSPNAGPELESLGQPERLWEVVANIKKT